MALSTMETTMSILFVLFFSHLTSAISDEFPPQPHWWNKPETARYIAHISNWGTLATIASHDPIKGFPYAKVFSISDGIPGESSTGTPYFYVSSMDVSAQDIAVDPRVTLSLSEAQSDICLKGNLDPQDPTCAKIMITGKIAKITDEKEIGVARSLLLARHPAMASWPSSHGWYWARLDVQQVQMLDFYGGITTLTPEKYYRVELYPKN